MDNGKLLSKIDHYYTKKVLEHGPSHRGVDWNSTETQELRFCQLLKLCDFNQNFSLIDYGCGYGYLYQYMQNQGYKFNYHGIDISNEMISSASKMYGHEKNFTVEVGADSIKTADYAIASGVLNVKLETPLDQWKEYVFSVIQRLDKLSKKGFAFNCLTQYSDIEKQRSDLFYANPNELFEYCMALTGKAALLHDYNLYEFTLLARKRGNSGGDL